MTMMYAAKIIAAILGGFVGLSLILHNKPVTRYRIVTEGLATAIFSAGLVDKFFLHQSVAVCSVFGLIVGFLNGYFLDFLKSIAPKLAEFSFKKWFARAFGFELPDEITQNKPPPPTPLNQYRKHK